ncbi:DNA repair protein RecN [Thermodesulfobacteriota bacterium]
MLAQLTISNFAIISHLEIDFEPGLNILSGETGAGKSIIINAVNLILGGRASADLIRSGAKEARVEALFTLPDNPFLAELMSELGFPFDGEMLIKRTISRGGRNRIMINGSMATLQTLSRVGMMMISISGQHEHQFLLRPDSHLYLLDDFGGFIDERLALAESFNRYESLKDSLRRLRREIKESSERQDLALFQVKEIEAANITEGEDSLLEDDRKRLRYSEQLKEIINGSYQILYEKEDSVLSMISLCVKRMEKGAEMDRRLDSLRKALDSVRAEVEEAGLELRDLQNSVVIDPSRLEEVEERIQLLNSLKRKYGPSLEDTLAFKEKLSGMIGNLDRKEKELEGLNKELKQQENDTVYRAIALSKKRKISAEKLEKSVEAELNLLDMGGTRFEVNFIQEDLENLNEPDRPIRAIRPDGYDRIEFMLSSNIGEDLRPLSRIASGGELSRIMLAMKSILARKTSVETIIFDEVDSGIGGATAEVVGEKLQSLAKYHQILCITHLPQIASKGETHFLVKKRVKDNRAQTVISELGQEGRVNEIARLLGGKVISEQAVEHAREMLSL